MGKLDKKPSRSPFPCVLSSSPLLPVALLCHTSHEDRAQGLHPQRTRQRQGTSSPLLLLPLFFGHIGFVICFDSSSYRSVVIFLFSLFLGGALLQIVPEEEDDMWHSYNLIAVGDSVMAVTVRCVSAMRFFFPPAFDASLVFRVFFFTRCFNFLYNLSVAPVRGEGTHHYVSRKVEIFWLTVCVGGLRLEFVPVSSSWITLSVQDLGT